MCRFIFSAALLIALTSGNNSQARDDDGLSNSTSPTRGDNTESSVTVGDCVVVIRSTSKQLAGANQGPVEMGQCFYVQAIDHQWLWPDYGKPGWISSKDVLPADKALEHFTRLIALLPNDPKHYQARGSVHLAQENWDQAIQDLDQAIRLLPSDDFNYRQRGMAWHRKREYAKALADFNRAIELNPRAALYRINRGATLENQRDYKQALADFDEAVRLDPEHAGSYNNRAYLLATCPEAHFRDGQKAMRDAMTACRLSGWLNYTYLGTLAAACAEAGDFEQAIRHQTTAKQLAPATKKETWQQRLDFYLANKPYRENGPW